MFKKCIKIQLLPTVYLFPIILIKIKGVIIITSVVKFVIPTVKAKSLDVYEIKTSNKLNEKIPWFICYALPVVIVKKFNNIPIEIF